MTEHDRERLEHRLKNSLSPTSAHPHLTLRRDLWPDLLRRLERDSVAVPWFDWALLAAVAALLAFFPRAIPVLLYHL